MIENYLHKSQMLRCVFLLIDIRHEPSSNDKLMYDWIVSQGFQPILPIFPNQLAVYQLDGQQAAVHPGYACLHRKQSFYRLPSLFESHLIDQAAQASTAVTAIVPFFRLLASASQTIPRASLSYGSLPPAAD